MSSELHDWLPYADFSRILDHQGSVGNEVVTSPHYQYWRDAWIACETARNHRASHVCLIHDPRPDFAIRIDDEQFLYEATEALKPARRRNDEYRAQRTSEANIIPDPVDDWVSPEDVIAKIRERANDKSAKDYPFGCRLVICVNMGQINGPQSIDAPLLEQLDQTALHEAVTSARANFAQVELLYQGELIVI
jgi:hypothetical protein